MNAVVSACGMHTSLGGLVDARAAFLCGLSRSSELTEWPIFDDETLHEACLVGHPAAGVFDGFQGAARLVRLGRHALADLHANSAGRIKGIHLPVHLALGTAFLPASDEDTDTHRAQRIMQGLGLSAGWIPRLFPGTVLGCLDAIRQAVLGIVNGDMPACLIGAIDSNLLGPRIKAELERDALKTVNQPVGYAPGEAAVFVLLEAQADGAPDRDRRQSSLTAFELAVEPVPNGSSLASLIDRVLSSCTHSDGQWWADLNGEAQRAMEFGNALVCISGSERLREWPVMLVASSFGDVGCAAPLHQLALASERPRALANLITVSALTGACGAMMVEVSRSGNQ